MPRFVGNIDFSQGFLKAMVIWAPTREKFMIIKSNWALVKSSIESNQRVRHRKIINFEHSFIKRYETDWARVYLYMMLKDIWKSLEIFFSSANFSSWRKIMWFEFDVIPTTQPFPIHNSPYVIVSCFFIDDPFLLFSIS